MWKQRRDVADEDARSPFEPSQRKGRILIQEKCSFDF